jgi:hypothetical protein
MLYLFIISKKDGLIKFDLFNQFSKEKSIAYQIKL